MDELGLHPEWAVFRPSGICGETFKNICAKNGKLLILTG